MYGSQKKIQKQVDKENNAKYKFSKNAKRPVDENAPKAPLSTYMSWAKDNRAKIVKANSDAGVTEITKILGQEWKGIKASEKKKYTDAYTKAKSKYDKLMNAYKLSGAYKEHIEKLEAFKLHQTRKPFKKDPNAPKRAASAYLLFTNAERENVMKKNKDVKITEVMKLLGAAWKELSAAKKATWEKKAVKAKETYAKDLEKYEKSAERKEYLEEKAAYEAKQVEARKRLVANKKRKLSSPIKGKEAKKPKKAAEGKKSEAKKPKAKKSSKSKKGKSEASKKKSSSKKSKNAKKPKSR